MNKTGTLWAIKFTDRHTKLQENFEPAVISILIKRTYLPHYQNRQLLFPEPSRRFGKSLLISTIEAYFQGKKELFEGLAMEKLEKDWNKHPILHLDLNAKKFDTEDDLLRLIDRQLLIYEQEYGSANQTKQ